MVATRKAVPYEPEGRIDLKNPDLYTNENYHTLVTRIRVEEPVYWNPEADSTGFWAITRYEDALRVVQDPQTFSAAVENGGMRIFDKREVSEDSDCAHLLSMDPPQHTQLRRALLPLFTPKALSQWEANIRARAIRLFDVIGPSGRAEFVSAIAAPMGLGVLTDLLDVGEEDAPLLFKWSNALVADDDPDYQASLAFRDQCVTEMEAYAKRLFQERKGKDGDDLVSLLADAVVDGSEIEYGTYVENFAMFLVAANESARHTISASVLALSDFPSERSKLLNDHSLIPVAVKEIVRLTSPVMHVRRTALKDTEIGGKHIRKGDKVVVWYNFANRDETVWPDAHCLDVCRYASNTATPHLGFGSAPHRCLGWRVAEIQIGAVLEQLLSRFPDIRVTRKVRRLRSNFIGGVKEMHVAFTPERGLM